MGRRRASIDWCPASPPCTHTHIDSPFLPSTSHPVLPTFFNPLSPTLFHFPAARPSYFSFGRETRLFFGVAHLSQRHRYSSGTAALTPLASSRLHLVSQMLFSNPPTSNNRFFPSFVTSFRGIPVCSEFPLQRVPRLIVSPVFSVRRASASFVLSLFTASPPSPPRSFLVHVLNRFYTL